MITDKPGIINYLWVAYGLLLPCYGTLATEPSRQQAFAGAEPGGGLSDDARKSVTSATDRLGETTTSERRIPVAGRGRRGNGRVRANGR